MTENNRKETGVLYIVATPIGNLSDIGLRALEVLKQVDLILAEDTRVSMRLLNHFNIATAVKSYHDHSAPHIDQTMLEYIVAGKSIALISDAGTPLLSDPGYRLVDKALAMDIPLVTIPGASAVTAALSRSGISVARFSFEGFLPAKRIARRKQLDALNFETRSMVFFESPHRLRDCLLDMQFSWGDMRTVALVQEISKIHERTKRGKLSEILNWLAEDPRRIKGESVIVAQAGETQKVDGSDTLVLLMEAVTLSQAVELTAKITGIANNELYQLALKIANAKPKNDNHNQ